jgi:hypothetical protein
MTVLLAQLNQKVGSKHFCSFGCGSYPFFRHVDALAVGGQLERAALINDSANTFTTIGANFQCLCLRAGSAGQMQVDSRRSKGQLDEQVPK